MKTDSLIVLIAAAAAVVIVASAQRPSAAASSARAAGGQSPLFGGSAGALWEDPVIRDLRAAYGDDSFSVQLARRTTQPVNWQMGTFQ